MASGSAGGGSNVVIAALGPEKSLHLSEAIKSKLASLNVASSDGVLAEYVIVLLANNNSLNKIYEELGLFMGPEVAAVFVQWLGLEIEQLVAANSNGNVSSATNSSAAVSPAVASAGAIPTGNVPAATTAMADVQMGQPSAQLPRSFTRALNSAVSSTAQASTPQNRASKAFSEQKHPSDAVPKRHSARLRSPSPARAKPGAASALRRVVKNTSNPRAASATDGQRVRLTVDFDREEREAHQRSGTAVRGRLGRGGRRASENTNTNANANAENDTHEDGRKQKSRIKCSFWPNCRESDDTCPNIHPTEPCKNFPSCPYGSSCTFVHPSVACRYQARCQNPLCNYEHSVAPMATAFASMTPAIASGTGGGASSIMCRFYPHCANPICPYLHPIAVPCKFSTGCTRPDCPYEHPEGRKGAQSRSVVYAPCKYGKQCARVDCPYQHPKDDTSSADTPQQQQQLPPTPTTATAMID